MGPASGPPSTPTSSSIEMLGGCSYFDFLGSRHWFLNFVL